MKQRRLPRWKKLVYSLIVLAVAAPPLYVVCEVAYRFKHDIPVLLISPATGQDSRTLSEGDTSAMDFDSVYYYELFRESANPVLYYEPRPNFSKGAVQINSHGFRDREFSLKKPDRTTRIVVLGDSIIWGHGIAAEDTFAKQLEALLAERLNGRFEVLNFGVSGYSLQQEAEMYLARAKRFNPDIAILGLCVNDMEYSSLEGDFFRARNCGIFAKSYLKQVLLQNASYALHRYANVPPRYLQRTVDVRYEMQRLKADSPEVAWLVLMFPLLENLEEYYDQWIHEALTEPAREQGFIVHDLLPDFRRHAKQELGVDHIHPNRFGNQVAAEAAFDLLLSQGMISASQ